jgi:hypothetical protein
MLSWVVVTDQPYIAATDGAGNFSISDASSGSHTLEVWHETLGKITRTVTVKDGEDAKVTIELARK